MSNRNLLEYYFAVFSFSSRVVRSLPVTFLVITLLCRLASEQKQHWRRPHGGGVEQQEQDCSDENAFQGSGYSDHKGSQERGYWDEKDPSNDKIWAIKASKHLQAKSASE